MKDQSQELPSATPVLELIVSGHVQEWIGNQRPDALQQADLRKIASQLAQSIRAQWEGEPLDDLDRGVFLELKHQIRQKIAPEKNQKKLLVTFLQFLKNDLQACLATVVDQALEERLRDSYQLEKLANDASLDINQLLLHAKKELGEIQHPSGLDSSSREALMRHVHELEEEYAGPTIAARLRDLLGITFVAKVRMQLHDSEVEFVRYKCSTPLDPSELDQKLTHYRQSVQSQLDEAAAAVPVHFQDMRIQHAIFEDLTKLRTQFTDVAALLRQQQ